MRTAKQSNHSAVMVPTASVSKANTSLSNQKSDGVLNKRSFGRDAGDSIHQIQLADSRRLLSAVLLGSLR